MYCNLRYNTWILYVFFMLRTFLECGARTRKWTELNKIIIFGSRFLNLRTIFLWEENLSLKYCSSSFNNKFKKKKTCDHFLYDPKKYFALSQNCQSPFFSFLLFILLVIINFNFLYRISWNLPFAGARKQLFFSNKSKNAKVTTFFTITLLWLYDELHLIVSRVSVLMNWWGKNKILNEYKLVNRPYLEMQCYLVF